jgi:hypothetical protein
MAAVNCNAVAYVDEQHQCFNNQTTENCVNCALKEQQLQATLLELKSAQAIISLLCEDIKYANHPSKKVIQMPVQTVETTGHDQANLKWKTVLCKNINNKRSRIPEAGKMKYPYL